MAFWNAPLNVDGHESMACDATLEMHKALLELNLLRKKEAEELKQPFLELKIGIGVNTGNCVVGNMGSDQRFDYSVLGDAVNLASRLEGQSKGYGVKTVIGPETYDAVKEKYATLQLDKIAVKGKKEAVSIFTLLGNEEFKNKQEYKLLLKNHAIMLESYFKQDWDEAIKLMDTSKNLLNGMMKEYYKIMKERIDIFKKEPLSKDWDGVFVATSK